MWSRAEEQQRGKGLYIKTMELKPLQQIALRVLKNWGIMRLFNKLNFAKGIAKSNSKIYAACGAIIGLIVENEDKNFLSAGRVMERIWLEATKLGMNIHLLTGVLFYYQALASNEKLFSERHKKLIYTAYEKTKNALDVDSGLIALLFRVGYDGQPSATSPKKKPIIY